MGLVTRSAQRTPQAPKRPGGAVEATVSSSTPMRRRRRRCCRAYAFAPKVSRRPSGDRGLRGGTRRLRGRPGCAVPWAVTVGTHAYCGKSLWVLTRLPRRRRGPSPPTSRGLCTQWAASGVPRGGQSCRVQCQPCRVGYDARLPAVRTTVERRVFSETCTALDRAHYIALRGVALREVALREVALCGVQHRGCHRLDEREDRPRLVERLRTADERPDRLRHAMPCSQPVRTVKQSPARPFVHACHAASCYRKRAACLSHAG